MCPSSGAERAPLFLLPGAFPHEGKNEGKARMFPESREGPSTGGEAEERSGYVVLCEVSAQRLHSQGRGTEAEPYSTYFLAYVVVRSNPFESVRIRSNPFESVN